MAKPIFNPQTKTRYLAILPSEFEIEPFQVSSIVLPSLSIKETYDFFGFNTVRRGELEYSDCELDIISGEKNNPTKKLMESMNKRGSYDFRVELLDPLGMVITDYKINGFIKSIQFDELKYGDDGLFKTKVTFGINNIHL
jgi:hypothetical protein